MTHRDGIARFSARSVRRGDTGYREASATLIAGRSAWAETRP